MTERIQPDQPQETGMTMPLNMSSTNSSNSSAANALSSGGAIPVTNQESIAQLEDTHYIVVEEYTLEVPMVCPKQKFLNILKEGGAAGENFTKKEVIFYLKEYISKRQLYDPENPRVVYCKEDPLGKLFNVPKFTITEALKLIEANCYQLQDTCIRRKQRLVAKPKTGTTGPNHTNSPVITTVAGSNSVRIQVCSSSPIISSSSGLQTSQSSTRGATGTTSANSKHGSKNRKNKGGYSSGDSSTSSGRRRQTSLSINISDTESSAYPWCFNVQMDTETEADKKDDDKNNEEEEELIAVDLEVESDRIAVEYEVASDDDDIISSTSSVSGISETSVFIVCGDSDVEFWADSSDGELSEGDKWSCAECKTQNSPLHGYCIKCWKMRPGWLPEKKEVGRKRRLERSDSKNKEVLSSSECSDIMQPQQKLRRRKSTISTELESDKEIVQEENDSGICTFSSQQSSQESINRSDTVKDRDNFIPYEKAFSDKSQKMETYRTLLNYQAKNCTVDNEHIFKTDNKSLLTSTQTQHCQVLSESSNLKHDKSRDTTELSAVPVKSNAEIKPAATSNSGLTAVAGSDLEKEKSAVSPPDSVDLCIVCLKRPKTASIIHGCTGHQVCCLRCARRLKRRGHLCPVCRRPIQKVIRNFIM